MVIVMLSLIRNINSVSIFACACSIILALIIEMMMFFPIAL